MKTLIKLSRQALQSAHNLPFSIYHCRSMQQLRKVPIFKPTAVFILSGKKFLGGEMNVSGHAGQFIFLSENPELTLSNHPGDEGYLALFIEFEYNDFSQLKSDTRSSKRYLIADMPVPLIKSITQFVECSHDLPAELWNIRRKEILQLLCYFGHQEIVSMISRPRINHQIIDVLKEDLSTRWDITNVSRKLAMSESTLRRKLKNEGTGFRDLHTQVKLAHGMHLLQTTGDSISIISQKCGYLSQSRFTERFKDRFGLTPNKLRQAKLAE